MKVSERIKKYQFEIRHLIVLFLALVLFQIILSYIHNTSTGSLLDKTMDLYKQDSAERIANLTSTSIEIVLELSMTNENRTEEEKRKIIEAFNIILSQQALQQNVDEICIIIPSGDKLYTFDDGVDLYTFFFEDISVEARDVNSHPRAVQIYLEHIAEIDESEQIYSLFEDGQTFHVLVPFVPKGEYIGIVYMRITPDLTKITEDITTTYDETGAIFSALILFGLLAMFFITSHTVNERDAAQSQLFKEREQQLSRDIAQQKEALFTKRIYHAHHKAEKIMGFIKDDIKELSSDGIDDFRSKATKYSNFVSRVIYDMKSYDPPIHAIRGPIFQTDLNDTIEFIVKNIFQRVYNAEGLSKFKFELDRTLPKVEVNEYVAWEVIEPVIQNCIDHNPMKDLVITIRSRIDKDTGESIIEIEDNGNGIAAELLAVGEDGIRELFHENITTKESDEKAGYGCYLSYEISKHRCGWELDAENIASGGARFTFRIPNV